MEEGDNCSDKKKIEYVVEINGEGVFKEEYEYSTFNDFESAKNYAVDLYSKCIKHPTQIGGRTFDIRINKN